jgi:hypothetical protein
MERFEQSFLDTGLDFSVDEFDPVEKAAMLKWYADVHDYKGLDLAPNCRDGRGPILDTLKRSPLSS